MTSRALLALLATVALTVSFLIYAHDRFVIAVTVACLKEQYGPSAPMEDAPECRAKWNKTFGFTSERGWVANTPGPWGAFQAANLFSWVGAPTLVLILFGLLFGPRRTPELISGGLGLLLTAAWLVLYYFALKTATGGTPEGWVDAQRFLNRMIWLWAGAAISAITFAVFAFQARKENPPGVLT